MSRLDGIAFGSLGRGSSNGLVNGIAFGSWGKIVDDFLELTVNSPAFDMATILDRAGIGTIGVDLFVGVEPETPDKCITVYDTGGFSPNPKFLRDEPTVQFKSRGLPADGKTPADLLQSIRNVLLNSVNKTVGDSLYIQYREFGGIIDLGADEKNRVMYVTNFRLVRTLSIITNRE